MLGPDSPLVVDDFIQDIRADDRAWVAAGIEHFGADAVIDAITRAVDGSRPEASIALAFLRDHANRGRELRAAYLRSGLPELLRVKSTVAERNIRVWSIYSLSRLWTPGAAQHLRQLLPWCELHDPFALDGVIFDLHLHCGSRYDPRPDVTAWARSRHHLARWSAFAYLWERHLSYGRSAGWPVQLVRQLAQDRHPRIRADARRALEWRRATRRRPDVGNAPVLEIEQLLQLWLSS